MLACVVENRMIVNVIEIPNGEDPALFGTHNLPEGKWIGDLFSEPTATEILDVLLGVSE